MGNSAITFRNVRKTYSGNTTAVDNLTLEIPQGSLTVFVGPSGCGKTTSLRMINRMVEPTSGSIAVNGQDVRSTPPAELRRSMGYVMQATGLFPHRTALENIATVARLVGQSKRQARARAEELLETVGLEKSLGTRYPAQLSGGQQQRVGVARALAADPPILLMDEPFSAVDPVVRADLQNELLELKRQLNKTIVFVTHDMDEAVSLGDRVAVFATGGRLAQYATPQQVLREPADQFVSDFVGRDRGFRALSFDHHNIPLSGVMIRDHHGNTTTLGAGDIVSSSWSVQVDQSGCPVGWIPPRNSEHHNVSPTADSRDTEKTAHRVGGSLYRPGGSLRSALDAALSSPSGLAVAVDERGRLRGVLPLAEIIRAIESSRKARA